MAARGGVFITSEGGAGSVVSSFSASVLSSELSPSDWKLSLGVISASNGVMKSCF